MRLRKAEQPQGQRTGRTICPLRMMHDVTPVNCAKNACTWWVSYDNEYQDGECAMVVATDALRWISLQGAESL